MPELQETLVCLHYFLGVDCCEVYSLLDCSVTVGFLGQFITHVEHFSHEQGQLKSGYLHRLCELPESE